MKFVQSPPTIFSDSSFGPCANSCCSGCQCPYKFLCAGCGHEFNAHSTAHRYSLYVDSRPIGKITKHDYTCISCYEENRETKSPGGFFVVYKSEIICHKRTKTGKLVHGTMIFEDNSERKL